MRYVWITMALLGMLDGASIARAGDTALLADPGAAIACQAAIGKASVTFVAKRLKLLESCTGSVFGCVQTSAGDADALARCLARANGRCAKAAAKIDAQGDTLVARIVGACGALDPADLTGVAGLGFDVVAAECAAGFGVTPGDAAGAAECVRAQQACVSDRMLQAENPRVAELLALTDADLGTACLEDLGGSGAGSGDPKLGAALVGCERAIHKSNASVVARKLRLLGHCLGAVFACVQRNASDAACVEDARQACDRDVAEAEADAVKLETVVFKGCGRIDFARVAPDTGLHTDAMAEQCATYGIFFVGSLSSYKNCIHRQHECQGDELVRFAVPRAAELLGLVGRTLPGQFFCPVVGP